MKKVVINNKEYELVKNYRDGFDADEVNNKYTDYFADFDYIAGDWSYGKLRLKGFCDPKGKWANNINKIELFDEYIEKYCARNCRYFLVKKIK